MKPEIELGDTSDAPVYVNLPDGSTKGSSTAHFHPSTNSRYSYLNPSGSDFKMFGKNKETNYNFYGKKTSSVTKEEQGEPYIDEK